MLLKLEAVVDMVFCKFGRPTSAREVLAGYLWYMGAGTMILLFGFGVIIGRPVIYGYLLMLSKFV